MVNWHHAPIHQLTEAGVYCVTGATYLKTLVFHRRRHLDDLQDAFFEFAIKFAWMPQAWSFFPNHYHFVATSPDEPNTLRQFLNEFHSKTARDINRDEVAVGRRVWYQFWDTDHEPRIVSCPAAVCA